MLSPSLSLPPTSFPPSLCLYTLGLPQRLRCPGLIPASNRVVELCRGDFRQEVITGAGTWFWAVPCSSGKRLVKRLRGPAAASASSSRRRPVVASRPAYFDTSFVSQRILDFTHFFVQREVTKCTCEGRLAQNTQQYSPKKQPCQQLTCDTHRKC